MFDQKMAEAQTASGAMLSPRSLTITERLEQEKAVLEKRLEDLNEALTVLRETPQIQRVIDIVTRVARY